jgi:hypothetical protein
VIDTSQSQSKVEQLDPSVPGRKSGRKSLVALSVFALGLNAAAAAYTMSPSDFALPDVSGLVAELLPHEGATKPVPDAVVAALSDIQAGHQRIAVSLQDNGASLQQNAALLQENGSSLQRNVALLQDNRSLLQQNTALLQQDATKLDILRSSLTDEQSGVKTISTDVKAMSTQISALIAKVDLLQSAVTTEITSSIPKGRAHKRMSGLGHRRLFHPMKADGYVSMGHAPMTTAPASGRGPST